MKRILLGILVFIELIIVFFWWKSAGALLSSGSLPSISLAIGRLCGLQAVFFVLLQLMLIGRIKWVERWWGHDKLAHLHTQTGRLLLYSITAHFLLILSSYSAFSKINPVAQLFRFFASSDDLLNAFIAFVLFVVIALSSIFISRLKLKYEAWYFVHLFVYLAILLAYGHQLNGGSSFSNMLFAQFWISLYVFVLGNFVVFRFLKPTYTLFKHRFYVKSVTSDDAGDTIIVISGKNMEQFRRLPGQFMIFRFLDKKRFWQAHPFSLSWGTNNLDIRVTAKDSGDFTHELSSLKPGTPVYIDGPHGRFTPKDDEQKLLLIAGGIGITPIRSILETFAGVRDISFMYSNKLKSEVPLKKEIEDITKKNSIPAFFFYTEEKMVEKGEYADRINAQYIKNLVPDFKQREVYICGPKPFIEAISQDLEKNGVSSNKIHFEIFSFH